MESGRDGGYILAQQHKIDYSEAAITKCPEHVTIPSGGQLHRASSIMGVAVIFPLWDRHQLCKWVFLPHLLSVPSVGGLSHKNISTDQGTCFTTQRKEGKGLIAHMRFMGFTVYLITPQLRFLQNHGLACLRLTYSIIRKTTDSQNWLSILHNTVYVLNQLSMCSPVSSS